MSEKKIKVLFVTSNNVLRSTTCVLESVFRYKVGSIIEPTIVFPESGSWSQSLEETGIDVLYRRFKSMEWGSPLSSFIELVYWVRLIRSRKINLIHVNEHENYTAIRLAAKVTNTPIVVFCHFVLDRGFSSWLFSKPYVPDRLLFTSSDQLERNVKNFPPHISAGNLTMVSYGRDFDAFVQTGFSREEARARLNLKENDLAIGTASAIRPRKRIEDFIDTIKNLVDSGHSVKAFVAGGGKFADPEYVQFLEQRIIEQGLTEHVKMLGNIEQVNAFYQALDVFLSTSELETFGMSVCEAMAFGVPVLAYEGGSVQEVVNDPFCIVQNYDVAMLSERVKTVLNDRALAKSLGKKARERVFECYNAEKLADTIVDVYEHVLHK